MNKKNIYRELNDDESKEIERLSNNAEQILLIDSNKTEMSIILNKIDVFVKSVRNDKTDKESVEKYAYEIGSLFGNLIRIKYGWQWYYLEKENEIYYCVAPNNRRVCCAPHNYFYSILNNTHNNNFKLLFNMIKEQYPKDWEFTFLS
jgi:hypothetical protein